MHVWLILMNFTWIKHVYSIFQTYLGWQCQLTKIYLLGIGRNHKPDSVSAKIPCWAWLYVMFRSFPLLPLGMGRQAWNILERCLRATCAASVGTVAVRKEWTDVNRFSWWYLNMVECIWHIWCAGQAWSGMKVWSDQHKHYQTLASAYDLDRLYIVSAWFLQCCFCVEL